MMSVGQRRRVKLREVKDLSEVTQPGSNLTGPRAAYLPTSRTLSKTREGKGRVERVKHPTVSNCALPWLFFSGSPSPSHPGCRLASGPIRTPTRPPLADCRKEAQMAGEDEAPSQAHPAVALESTTHLLLLP